MCKDDAATLFPAKSNWLKIRHPALFRQLSPSQPEGVNVHTLTVGVRQEVIWKCPYHVGCTDRSHDETASILNKVQWWTKVYLKRDPELKDVDTKPLIGGSIETSRKRKRVASKPRERRTADQLTEETAVCTSCKETKKWEQFGLRSTGVYHAVCLMCKAAMDKHGKQKRRQRSEEEILKSRNELRPDGLKICSDCQKELPFEFYYEDDSSVDGLSIYCKECCITHASEFQRYYQKQTPEEVDAVRKKMYPSGTKKCSKCEQLVSLDQFCPNASFCDGLRSYCLPCDLDHQQNMAADVRAYKQKEKTKCEDCGWVGDYRGYDFAYIDPSLKYRNKHGLVVNPCALSLSALKNERSNLRVLCANCRRVERYDSYEMTAGHRKDFCNSEKEKRGCCNGCKIPVRGRPHMFDFDHLPEFKKIMEISRMRTQSKYSNDDLMAEMNKCQLLCALCHRLTTWKRWEDQKKKSEPGSTVSVPLENSLHHTT